MTDTLASLARDMERDLLTYEHKPFSHRAIVLHLANTPDYRELFRATDVRNWAVCGHCWTERKDDGWVLVYNDPCCPDHGRAQPRRR